MQMYMRTYRTTNTMCIFVKKNKFWSEILKPSRLAASYLPNSNTVRLQNNRLIGEWETSVSGNFTIYIIDANSL